MIAIYDQDHTSTREYKDVFVDGDTVKGNLNEIQRTFSLGFYKTLEQAKYVHEQINKAIEQGDKLYRMPSAEDVEMEMAEKEKCRNCKNNSLIGCHYCHRLSNWQPKKQEGKYVTKLFSRMYTS